MSRRTSLRIGLAISMFLLVSLCRAAAGRIIYVDADASGANDGSSWQNAYKYLQDALADANSAEKPVEIRIAHGIYKPTSGRFELTSGVALKGGYAGLGMPDPNTRDIALYETILSGDLAGNDVELNDPSDLEDEPTRADNAGIFSIYQADSSAVLDGVTITGGRQQNPADGRLGGGGLAIGESSPTIMNCTFRANWADRNGGAVFIYSGDPTFHNCTFSKNYAYAGGAIGGGGDNTIITHCSFTNNAAQGGGGALAYCAGLISNCIFRGNSANRRGGALVGCNGLITYCLFFDNSAGEHGGAVNAGYFDSPTFENCVFANNVAAQLGGGIVLYYDSSATLINCSFSSNSATNGHALASYLRIPNDPPNNAQLTNCILWDGGNEIWKDDNSTIRVNYSNVYGGYNGIGNIDEDPLFADPNNGDYHLKSQAGRWDANEGRWTKDDVTSPLIDAGEPMSPIGNEPFPNGGRINMGAYGGTAEASKSYFGKPTCETIVAGDINGDCKVDFADFMLMAMHWLEER